MAKKIARKKSVSRRANAVVSPTSPPKKRVSINSSKKDDSQKNTKRTSPNDLNRDSKNAPKKAVRRSSGKISTRKTSVFEKELSIEHRLQKILAAAGFGSRRHCEVLIEQGRVEVDNQIAKLGCKVDPTKSEIKVDGVKWKRTRPVYLALFKPKGFLCTDYDQQGRARAIDLIPESFGRLFLIGRLDKESEGLILLTNDGAFSERLTHPKYGIAKVYRILVAGEVSLDTIAEIRRGVYFAEGFAKAEQVVIKGHHKQSTILDVTLAEGMNREVRRLFARFGHKVMSLIRISVGPIKLGKLAPGEWRRLSEQEVKQLYSIR
ncbi:MAG: pseudouridine synthase [Thermoguttaceae bacterium]